MSKKTPAEYQLRLYVAGHTPRSAAALKNLRAVCETHLAGRYDIEVIDLRVNPQLAAGDQILAVPTLVRRLPEPMKKIIGDLSDDMKVLVGLDIQPVKGEASVATTESSRFRFTLYVAGVSSRSGRAIVNVRAFCERRFGNGYVLEVIDILNRPDIARREQLVAAPTLVKERPLPAQRFIGDMTQPEVLAARLGLA